MGHLKEQNCVHSATQILYCSDLYGHYLYDKRTTSPMCVIHL